MRHGRQSGILGAVISDSAVKRDSAGDDKLIHELLSERRKIRRFYCSLRFSQGTAQICRQQIKKLLRLRHVDI